VLHSVFDDEAIAEVIDDFGIRFEDQRHSLSSAALILAHRSGLNWKTIRGPQFWKHEGKTLVEIRDQDQD
jgi:hypothetical protein